MAHILAYILVRSKARACALPRVYAIFRLAIESSAKTQVRHPHSFFPETPPVPDDLSDPILTPCPTHPGIKYVARSLSLTTILPHLSEEG